MPKPSLPIFVSFSGEGGVEHMVSNLIHEFVRLGYRVDLLLAKRRSAHLARLPATVNQIHLGRGHTWSCLLPLARYLRRERPPALLVAKHRAIVVAVLARALAGVDTRLIGRLGTNLSASQKGKSRLQRALWRLSMRLVYPRVDQLIAVSEGVREDIRHLAGLPDHQVHVIRNPVITPTIERLAAEPLSHPWFQAGEPPVIVAAGRFTRQKDFPTLIEAYAQVRARRSCRLVILGSGRPQHDYEALAERLGIRADIDFPGFAANPYAYMGRASAFVLSSAWEGSPNVLTEALALGVPVVSTDCPSGPREILAEGRYGPLVPVGDASAMAGAISMVLEQPLPRDFLRAAVAEYTATTSARRYLEALGMAAA